MPRTQYAFLLLVVGFVLLSACDREQSAPSPSRPAEKAEVTPVMATARGVFGALPADAAASRDVSDVRTRLGRMLYFDKRLSRAGDVSCNSCHALKNYGVDNQPTSPGHQGLRGDRNSPTVYNAALHLAQFWDGRAADVEEQAKGPVLNPKEMAMPDEAAVVAVLKGIPGYVEAFKAAFPKDAEPVSFNNMAVAIGAFERRLLTPGRFDRFVGGDAQALTVEEQKGLETFIASGCSGCHNSPLLGGQAYQKMGLVRPYQTADVGRYAVTRNEADKQMFKVPSLRNVAKTAPYFHDGSVKTLDEAVRLMARHQLGRELTEAETVSIVAFLGSLTGEIDATYTAEPILPAKAR